MNPTVRNIIAVVAGLIIGSLVNFGIISASAYVIPPPPGVDVMDGESIAAAMQQFKPYHFIFPFLAHAVGTFVGAFITSRIAVERKMLFALLIGFLFFLGGLLNVFWIPAPTWFVSLDLVVAYFPMAYLGGKLFRKKK